MPVLFGKVDLKIKPVPLPAEAYFPDGRPFIPDDLRKQAKAEVEKAEAELEKAKEKPEAAPVIAAAEKKLEGLKAAIPALEARLAAEHATTLTPVPPNAEELAQEARAQELKSNYLLAQSQVTLAQYELEQAAGNEKKVAAATKKLETALKALKEPAEGYTPIGPRYPTTSTGRRLALAKWIGAKDESADSARCDQSHVDAAFRQAAGRHRVQLWPQRESTDASGASGLARSRVHGSQLGHEGHPPPDGDLECLQAAVFGLVR